MALVDNDFLNDSQKNYSPLDVSLDPSYFCDIGYLKQCLIGYHNNKSYMLDRLLYCYV